MSARVADAAGGRDGIGDQSKEIGGWE